MAPVPNEQSPIATMQISNRKGGLFDLLRTHPQLEERIAKLKAS
jgi:Zn-dependent protease with chaperone function